MRSCKVATSCAAGCVGWADKEREVQLRMDHVFRVFSNTKLVTSTAVLLLLEAGPDPDWMTRSNATSRSSASGVCSDPAAASLDDTEPAQGSITIRHLLSHSSGLRATACLDPGTLMFKAYTDRQVLHPGKTLPQMMDALAGLPLSFHPGTSWEYSVATDVLGRLVEVVSGQRLDAFFRARLRAAGHGRHDVHATARAASSGWWPTMPAPTSRNPMKPGLARSDQAPYPGAYLQPFAKPLWRRWAGFVVGRA